MDAPQVQERADIGMRLWTGRGARWAARAVDLGPKSMRPRNSIGHPLSLSAHEAELGEDAILEDTNAELIRRNFELFQQGHGEAVYAAWAPDAVWHVLDATRFQGDYTRDEYFTMLGTTWAEEVPDYAFDVVDCRSYGNALVVVHLRSRGTTSDGPIDENGGLMIYRVVDGKIMEGWALSRGRDARTPF